jgi:hypothetical protein
MAQHLPRFFYAEGDETVAPRRSPPPDILLLRERIGNGDLVPRDDPVLIDAGPMERDAIE